MEKMANLEGRLDIVGIGPGAYEKMTIEAAQTLRDCDVIVGYTVYAELVREHFPGKGMLTTPMHHEEERCVMALDKALGGDKVALICSGDAGIYGMAGLVFAIMDHEERYHDVPVHIVPGVTAAVSGAALLGAPLMNDFAVISLSSLLTPKEVIEKRLRMAAMADLVIVLYNPGSHRRKDGLRHACEILMESRSPKTLCGVVRQIGREGETVRLMTLRELANVEADMFTTAYIGCSYTRERNGRMVTQRGYDAEQIPPAD